MSLKAEVVAWNGKSKDVISGIFRAHREQPDFINGVIEIIDTSSCERGATWILKAWLEEHNELRSDHVATIFRSLNKLQHWEAKLHVLQSLPYLPISAKEKKRVEAFLRMTLMDENKFVRAWSYNGFFELSRQHPEYRDETQRFFDMAMRDEAASVKARIRNLMAKGF